MFNKSSVQKRNIMHWRKKNDDFTNRSIKAAVRTAKERITTVKIMIVRTLCSIQAASRSAKECSNAVTTMIFTNPMFNKSNVQKRNKS